MKGLLIAIVLIIASSLLSSVVYSDLTLDQEKRLEELREKERSYSAQQTVINKLSHVKSTCIEGHVFVYVVGIAGNGINAVALTQVYEEGRVSARPMRCENNK